MRSPTNVILAGLAGADLVSLAVQAPWHVFLYTMGRHRTAGAINWSNQGEL